MCMKSVKFASIALVLLTCAKVLVFGVSYLDAPWRTTVWNAATSSVIVPANGM